MYKNPPVPRQLVGQREIRPNLSPAYTNSGSSLSGVRLVGQQGEIRTGPQTSLRLCKLPVRPERGQDQTHSGAWQTLTAKIQDLMAGPTCPVWQLMPLGLLTATEKQVHLDQLHMRPIQWHLKNNWRVLESLEKVIPIPSK